MHELSRRRVMQLGFGCLALLGSLAAGSPLSAQTSLQIEKQRERLMVSVMALRDGHLLADDAAVFTPFQQHTEQSLTLDIDIAGQRHTLLLTIWDRDAGGVRVSYSVIDAQGHEGEQRAFIMYPLLEKVAHRAEPLRLPIMQVVDSGNDQLIETARIELHLTMKRVVRGR